MMSSRASNTGDSLRDNRTHEPARRWEPKRLRYRLYTFPAVLARGGQQIRLRYAGHHPWVALLAGALTALTILDST